MMKRHLLGQILLFQCGLVAHAWIATQHRHKRSRSLFLESQLFSSSVSQPPDAQYFTTLDDATTPDDDTQRITLTRYMQDLVKSNAVEQDMVSLLQAVKMACKTIANLVHRAGLNSNQDNLPSDNTYTDGRYYSMKRLDQLSTIVLQNALKYTGQVQVVAPSRVDDAVPEHQPGVLIAKSMDSQYVACLDPLDGSGNADASICTGTVFGVFLDNQEEQDNKEITDDKGTDDATSSSNVVDSVLQPARNMRAAGYCLYSSATVLVFTLGNTTGVQGFTLDPLLQEFVLTHRNLTIPTRGTVYSCNEANREGWDDSFKTYLKKIQTGQGQTGQRYAHRYVGSMVGDIHRTLLYGGLFGYPRDTLDHPQGNLQLLYKIAPMAFVLEQAGGRGVDETGMSLLNIQPERVHQKWPCFMGSAEDVNELETHLVADKKKDRLKP